jgi:GlpG protein
MRLIASFEQENQALSLYVMLKSQGVDSIFEPVKNSAGINVSWDVWILAEDDFDKSCDLLQRFYKEPLDQVEPFKAQEPSKEKIPLEQDAFSQVKMRPLTHPLVRIRMNAPLTRLLIAVCVFVFLWTNVERVQLLKKAPSLGEYALFTQVTQKLLFDFPSPYQKLVNFFEKRPNLDIKNKNTWSIQDRTVYQEIEKMPVWKGFYEVVVDGNKNGIAKPPMFVKILQGEIWRVMTPIFLHGNFLHILFNMLWLFLLGRELEIKVGKSRLLAICIIIAMITNAFQYLMSGPLFLGFSGVICGLGGFIWIREKIAPWEGYTVPRGTLGFLFIFVLGMMVLQLIAFIISFFHLGNFSVSGLGNTGHVAGLIAGCVLARVPIFNRLRG